MQGRVEIEFLKSIEYQDDFPIQVTQPIVNIFIFIFFNNRRIFVHFYHQNLHIVTSKILTQFHM